MARARRRRPPLLLLLLLVAWSAPAPAQLLRLDAAALDDGELGARCHGSGRCNVPLSRCEEGVCVCPPDTVAAAKGRRCLPLAERLGDGCEEGAQCARVAHAVCRLRVRACECRQGRVAAGDRCVAEARLGEACVHAAQCRPQGLTECSAASRRCVCAGIAFEAGGRCVTDDVDGVRDWEPPPAPPRTDDGEASGAATSLLQTIVCAVVVLLLAWQQV